MDELIASLLAVTGKLESAPGVPPDALADARRFIAAMMIQQDPALLPLGDLGPVDPAIREAVTSGAALAVERNAAGLLSTTSIEPYSSPTAAIDGPGRTLGPFTDGDGEHLLVRRPRPPPAARRTRLAGSR